jgi:hypothetical protein
VRARAANAQRAVIQSGSAASLAQQQQQPDAQLSSERPAKRLETAGGAPQAALPGHDAVSAPSSAALQGKKSALSDALKQELVYYTRTSCLHTPRSLVQVLQIDKKSQEVESERAKGKKEKRSVKRPSAPIIIVPAASSNSALNLHNIKQFLEEGIYVTPAQAMEQCPDKPNSVMVVHKHPLWGSVAYKVLDKVPIVDEAALERIVGVVVSGMGWQLKEFPFWNNDPAIIFSKCRGVYVYFDDQKKSDQVKAWNVADFPIKRQSRNKDPVQAHGVWQSICDHMQINHPKLVQALLQAHEARTLAEKSARLKATQSLLDEAEQVAGEDSDEEEDDELVGDREG